MPGWGYNSSNWSSAAPAVSSGLGAWFSNPENQRLLAGLGSNIAGQYLTNRGNAQQQEAANAYNSQESMLARASRAGETAQQARNRAISEYMQSLQRNREFGVDTERARSQGAANAIGGPYDMAGQRAQLAMRRALFEGIRPGATSSNLVKITPPSDIASSMGRVSGGIALDPIKAAASRYLGDDALMGNEALWRQGIASMNPNLPGLSDMSFYGDKGRAAGQGVQDFMNSTSSRWKSEQEDYEGERNKEQEALMGAIEGDIDKAEAQLAIENARNGVIPGLDANGKPPAGYEIDKKTGQLKKKSPSWWKKALAVAGAAAATYFTGGAAAPALGAAMNYARS